MDFNDELAADFQRYIQTYRQLKNTNQAYRNQLQTLDSEILNTENLLQTFNQRNGASDPRHQEVVEPALIQLDLKLKTAKDGTSQLQEELEVSEKKYAEVFKAIDEDKKRHEEEKQKIDIAEKLEKEYLIQEVENLRKQLQDLASENTNLQLSLARSENNHVNMTRDIQKLEENCKTLEAAKIEMKNKIAKFKLTSKEDLARIERQQRLKIIDLNRTGYQLQMQLNNLNKQNIIL